MSAYTVALVQNESEMLRYGWADIRPMVEHLKYEWVPLTSAGIESLFRELEVEAFDAIVIATNACNDRTVLAAFRRPENRELLGRFLQGGGGIFLSLQRRLCDSGEYGFLPEEYELTGTTRGERGVEGSLSIPTIFRNHIVFKSPHEVAAERLEEHCLHNEFVRSLYRAYITPTCNDSFDALIADDSYDALRPLLVCTKANCPGRLIATTIPLDWQGHQDLLDNCIKYVVEGKPHIAVLKKDGESVVDFEYLLASLEVLKVPYVEYVQRELDLTQVPVDVHSSLVIDAAFTEGGIPAGTLDSFRQRFSGAERLVFFSAASADARIVCTLGGPNTLQTILPTAVVWLRAQYAAGRWDNSFWQTFDVIEAFHELDISTDEIKEEVLAAFDDTVVDGSYDELMGASCALLKLYHMLLNDGDERKDKTLKWIEQNYSDASLFERASALDVLIYVGAQPTASMIAEFRSEVRSQIAGLDNETRIYRFARTLLSCGYAEECASLCRRFAAYQDSSGAWDNVARTASTALLLMRANKELERPCKELDGMVFRAITYLKGRYDREHGNWGGNPAATAKALRSIARFERNVSLPIDELVRRFADDQAVAETAEVVEVVARQSAELRSSLFAQGVELRKEKARGVAMRRLAGILGIILGLVATSCTVLVTHAITTDRVMQLVEAARTFLNDLSPGPSWVAWAAPWIVLYVVFRMARLLPELGIFPKKWNALIKDVRRLRRRGSD